MNPRIAFLAACAWTAFLGLAPESSAQTGTATAPAGFITLSIPGTGGAATNQISFKSLGLVQPVSYQGSAETVNVAAKTLTDNQATWANNEFNGANGAFYVEIVRPAGSSTPAPGEGTTYDIASTDAATKTLTLVQPLDASIVNGANFRVHKHWTIGSLFGATNTAGFQGSGSPSTADQILIWNGGNFVTYFYQIDPSPGQTLGGTGWRSTSASNTVDMAGTVIYPDDGLVFRILQNNPVNIVLLGAVKMGSSSFPISTGYNILANVYAAPMTLSSSGLQASGFTGSGSPSESDQVLLWNGTGYDTYFYQIDPSPGQTLGGTGWRSVLSNLTDAGSTAIPAGAAIVVRRVQSTSFNWLVPQHPANL